MDNSLHPKEGSISKRRVFIFKVLKFIKKTFFILFMALMVLMIFSLLNSKLKKQDPTFFGYKFYVVISQSMKPTFDMGSLVAVKSVSPNNLHIGDIITFTDKYKPDERISHRIVEIKSENNISFVTKGDANNGNDQSLVSSNNVVGKVVFHLPYIGVLLTFVRTKVGLIILIIIPSLVIGISEGIKLLTCLRKIDKDKKDDNHVGEV